jgi:hypothetical protein
VRGNAPEQFHNHEVHEETRREKEFCLKRRRGK